MKSSSKLIAYLFAKGEPVSKKQLTAPLKLSAQELALAIEEAANFLEAIGLTLIDDGAELDLRTHADAALMIEAMRKDEFSRDLGKAGLETLAVLLYKGPSSRSEIDYVRGVNSTYTLRTLTMRGLVRRIQNPRDERSFVYEPTTQLLAHLGVASREELPDFETTRAKIAELEMRADETAETKEQVDLKVEQETLS